MFFGIQWETSFASPLLSPFYLQPMPTMSVKKASSGPCTNLTTVDFTPPESHAFYLLLLLQSLLWLGTGLFARPLGLVVFSRGPGLSGETKNAHESCQK